MSRRIDSDCTLTYTVNQEAWYADVLTDDGPTLGIHATADGGGVKWEFQISEHDYGRGSCTRIRMYSDAYAALADVPELFEALRVEQPKTLVGVRAVLDRVGAKDDTERVSPRKARR